MTNAITLNATAQTRINGIGSALRCVAVVGRDGRARHEQPCDSSTRHAKQRDLLCLHAPGKRLALPSPSSPMFSMSAGDWRRPGTAATADQYLPPAAWASLVVQRAISA
jgi:hypothetical protein